jgi:hypothetical protein
MSIDRREINELCAEHDRLMDEAEMSGHWTPRQRPAPVRREKAAPVALEYKTYENSAPTAPVLTDKDWVKAIGAVLARERKLAREARAKEIAPLQTEIAELKGQVTALLTLLKSDDNKTVDLPRLAWRRGA